MLKVETFKNAYKNMYLKITQDQKVEVELDHFSLLTLLTFKRKFNKKKVVRNPPPYYLEIYPKKKCCISESLVLGLQILNVHFLKWNFSFLVYISRYATCAVVIIIILSSSTLLVLLLHIHFHCCKL